VKVSPWASLQLAPLFIALASAGIDEGLGPPGDPRSPPAASSFRYFNGLPLRPLLLDDGGDRRKVVGQDGRIDSRPTVHPLTTPVNVETTQASLDVRWVTNVERVLLDDVALEGAPMEKEMFLGDTVGTASRPQVRQVARG
jgi:hypothetical protein